MAESDVRQLTDGEFADWIPARIAFEAVSKVMSIGVAAATLSRRLELGEIVAAAGLAVWKEPTGQERRDRQKTLAPAVWSIAPTTDASHLWRSNDLDIVLRGSAIPGSDATLTLIKVRFEPGGLGEWMAPVEPVEDQTDNPIIGFHKPRHQDLPMLPESIGKAWAAWFNSAHPGGSKSDAERSAAQMFPNHNFPRRIIRELIEGKQVGRPRKTDP